MKLSKTVRSTRTFEAESCKLDFMEMSDRFRAIRSKSRNPMDKCHWCKHEFVNGEMMALAFTNRGNKVLCQTCGRQLMASDTTAESVGQQG